MKPFIKIMNVYDYQACVELLSKAQEQAGPGEKGGDYQQKCVGSQSVVGQGREPMGCKIARSKDLLVTCLRDVKEKILSFF